MPRGRQNRNYDEQALVAAIAAGRGHSQIARDLNMGRSTVSEIATGRARLDLQGPIAVARREVLEEVRLEARRHVGAALRRLVKLIGPDTAAPPSVQRKAAMDILRLCVPRLGRAGADRPGPATRRPRR